MQDSSFLPNDRLHKTSYTLCHPPFCLCYSCSICSQVVFHKPVVEINMPHCRPWRVSPSMFIATCHQACVNSHGSVITGRHSTTSERSQPLLNSLQAWCLECPQKKRRRYRLRSKEIAKRNALLDSRFYAMPWPLTHEQLPLHKGSLVVKVRQSHHIKTRLSGLFYLAIKRATQMSLEVPLIRSPATKILPSACSVKALPKSLPSPTERLTTPSGVPSLD
jgi:hypothetical protein